MQKSTSIILFLTAIIFVSGCFSINRGIKDRIEKEVLVSCYGENSSCFIQGQPFFIKDDNNMFVFMLWTDISDSSGTREKEHSLFIMHQLLTFDKSKEIEFKTIQFQDEEPVQMIIENGIYVQPHFGLRSALTKSYFFPISDEVVEESKTTFTLNGFFTDSGESIPSYNFEASVKIFELQQSHAVKPFEELYRLSQMDK
jgi:hypothetical protein